MVRWAIDESDQAMSTTEPAPRVDALKSVQLRDFLAEKLPEPTFIVPGLLPEGVSMIAGPPKAGKTWLAMHLSLAVYQGGQFLGRTLRCREVLYLSLESSENWIQGRWRRMLGDVPPERIPDGLELCFESLKLGRGFEEQLTGFIEARNDVGLVVVDTMVRVDPCDFTAGRTAYQQDAATLEGITEVARRFPGVAFVFLHHTREAKASNPLDALNGSRGLSGTLDGCWLLDHLDCDEQDLTQLTFVNRNAEPVEPLAVRMNETCRFEVVGPASRHVGGVLNQEILDALKVSEGPMTPKALVNALSEPGGKIRQYLCRLKRLGLVNRTPAGYLLTPTAWDADGAIATDSITDLCSLLHDDSMAEGAAA